MRHVGEKLAFRAVGFFELKIFLADFVAALAQLLRQVFEVSELLEVVEGDAQLVGDKLDKNAVLL